MEPYERIKYLRKEILHFNQEEFGKLIGMSRSNVANIESGRIALTERNIYYICKEFGINENWILTGEGKMEGGNTTETEIAAFIGTTLANEDNTFIKKFIHMLASLEESDWEVLEKMVNMMQEKNSD